MSYEQKLEWAWTHIKAFDAEVDAFFEDRPVGSRVEIDRDARIVRIWAEMPKEMPQHWPLSVGDIVHNLRSSLDHIVWAISAKHSSFSGAPEAQRRQIQFPICVERGEYFGITTPKPKEGQRNRRTRFLEAAPLAIIDGLQPHLRGSTAKDHPLAILSELSNEDKHHSVLLAAMVIHLPYVSFQGFGGQISQLATIITGSKEIASKTPIMELRFHNRIPETEVKVEATTLGQVALYKSGPGSDVIPAVEFLKEAHNFIGKTVFPQLEGFAK